MNEHRRIALSAAVGLLCFATGASAHSDTFGAVYTMTNAPDDNRIVVFSRDRDGLLSMTGTIATGGRGSGGQLDALASQGSLVLAGDLGRGDRRDRGDWLLAVNAGSNDVSVLRVNDRGLSLRDRAGSGGTFPVSVTAMNGLVYVLNNGMPANITGFRLEHDGRLMPLRRSTRMLGAGDYGQVAFDPRGHRLVVTDKGGSRILVFGLDHDGRPAAMPEIYPSAGAVPFGVTFDARGHVLVVEAGANAVSSYRLGHHGGLRTISASVANGQTATCWIALNGRGIVITTNPGTSSLSTYRLDAGTGQVTLINGTAGAAQAPLDLDLTRDGHYAYAVDPKSGGVDMFAVGDDGTLTSLGGADGGLELFAQGMAVR